MRKKLSTLFLPLFFLTLLLALCVPETASAQSLSKASWEETGPSSTPTPPAQPSLRTGGKSQAVQDPTWVAQKLAHKVIVITGKDGRRTAELAPTLGLSALSLPVSYQLDTSYVDGVWEPSVSGTDITGYTYNDEYMWDLCGPGASTVSLDYWSQVNDRVFSDRYVYTDPGATTTWNNTHTRSYLTYLAAKVNPPSYVTPGEMTWNGINGSETYVQDLVDALNWEASDHNTSNWKDYFYLVVWYNDLNLSTLNNYVDSDIANAHIAPIVLVNDDYLPDWPYIHTSHYVAITGYDNNAGTFTYEETCGQGSCPTTGGPYGKGFGHHTVDQQRLLDGIENDDGALIW